MYRGAQGDYVLGSRPDTVNQVVARQLHKLTKIVIYSYLAQLAEHLTVNQVVAGSSPAVGAIKEPHEPSSCGFFYYSFCYGTNLLGVSRLLRPNERSECVVLGKGFEPVP